MQGTRSYAVAWTALAMLIGCGPGGSPVGSHPPGLRSDSDATTDSGLPDAAGPADGATMGDGSVGSSWRQDLTIPGSPSYGGLWGAGDDLYLCGEALLHSVAGGAWSAFAPAPPGHGTVIWGSSSSDIYLSDESSIWHWNGASWTATTTPAGNRQVLAGWSSSLSQTYAVGSNGSDASFVLRSSGNGVWVVEEDGTTGDLYGIWGSAAADLYAIGQFGGILHSDGSGAWTVGVTLGPGSPTGVWGSGPTDVYAVSGDAIHHSTGGGIWTSVQPAATDLFGNPVVARLGRVWGRSANDIYALADGGAIYHSTGANQWTQATPVGTIPAAASNALWGVPSGHTYAVTNGAVFRIP